MSNEKLAEIRKLAVRLQTAAYDHGGIDASDRWSAKKYADADDRSRAALTTLMDKVSEALQAHAAEAAHPQPAQDASNPLKGWIFDKVNMGRGDERYICTPDGANATTVRNESTSDHRERLLWLIADAMVKESGR